jgi:uncharacterized membrane protein HdeD (DUF308 family)
LQDFGFTKGGHMPEIGIIASVIAILAGIIILIWPHIISYVVAIYLIVIGVVGIINYVR